jgi:hypothetical protein
MNNSTHITCARNPHANPRPGIAGWRRWLAAGLALGLAAFLPTVRADTVVFDDHFNNATNDLANNDLGVGGGFSAYSRNGIDAYEAAGSAYIATSFASYNMASIDSINPIQLAAGGTTVEFRGVTFSTNTPAPNLDTYNYDRLIMGVTVTNGAGNWGNNGSQSYPAGFWIQIMSDSIPTTAYGYNILSGNSTLFYKGTGTNLVQLVSWKFDNLKWSTNGANNFSPVLDIQLTLSSTSWALNITGDTATNNPISYSGTYAAGGVIGTSGTVIGITNELINGINGSYIGAYNQCARPPINMGIDEVKVTQLGSLVVTTPSILTPEYGYNTNTIYAGELVTLVSSITTPGTPTLQWQMEDLSSPGDFINLSGGNATNCNVDTTGFANTVKGFQLVASYGGNSVTSAIVKVAVNPASAPVLVQDVTPNFAYVYAGQGMSFYAVFAGNKPFTYQWQHSTDADGITFTNIPGATNATYVINSATVADGNWYELVVDNSQGEFITYPNYVNYVAGTPQYLWSAAIPFGGLNADQILTNFPSTYKIAGAMVATNGGLPIVVTTSRGNITFGPSGFSSATVSGANGYGAGANTNRTGDANFDTCLNKFAYDSYNGTHFITLSGLVVGRQYQVQLFALDDRKDYKSRRANWTDPSNVNQNVSMICKMGDDVYMLGTFTASNTVQTLQQNLVTVLGYSTNNGNFNCLVLRTVGWNPPPYFVYQPQNQTNFAGRNSSFIGIAAGDATLGTITYQWKTGPRGGPYTNIIEGAKYTGTTTTNLTIKNLTLADIGTNTIYVLAVTNGGGGQYSREAILYVQGAPAGIVNGSYAAYALSNHPAGLWMLDETNDPSSGALLAYDYSGNGKHGVYGSAVKDGFNGILSPQPPSYAGFYTNEAGAQLASALRSWITLPSLNFTNLEVTIALWMDPFSNGGYAQGLLSWRNTALGTGSGGSPYIASFQYANGGTTLAYNWADNALTYNFPRGPAPVQNQWNFVALVITATNGTIYDYYINSAGQAVLLKGVNPVPNTFVESYNGGFIYLGNDSYDTGGGRSFNGLMSGAAIYNHALTEAALQQMFAAGVGISTNFPPFLPTQPASTAAFTGSTVQFRVAFGGSPLFTNQWQFNGTNIEDGGQFLGAHSNVLTIFNVTVTNQGVYRLVLSNSVAALISSNATLTILTPTLVGEWLPGTQTLADVSGYSPTGTHDAFVQSGGTYWTNDVPPYAAPGRYSLYFIGAGLEVSNSATSDAGYKSTFDSTINSGMTVMFWAKGWPAYWGPFLSKYGENSIGWQFRVNNSTNYSCWTTRNVSGGGDLVATHFSNDGQWHHYAGTFDPAAGVKRLYVDGVLVAYQSGVGLINLASSSHLMIGAKDLAGTFGNYFTGTIYDVRIYDYALPQYQVASVGKGLGLNVAQNVYYTPGANATFTTPGIAAAPPYTGYAWQFNNGGGFSNLSDGALAGATISGSSTTSLTVSGITTNNAGLYQLLVTNGAGVTTNGMVNLAVLPAKMVGRWLPGSQSLADASGYAPAGTHNAGLVLTNGVTGGTVTWSTDVPASAPVGSYSLSFTNAGLIVSNTAATDSGYVNTFDDKINNGMTVMCWAKGYPGGWNPWVTKFGENYLGWQLRVNNGNPLLPGWSIRSAGGSQDMVSTLGTSDDGNWHHYAGTFSLVTGGRLYVDGMLAATQTNQGPYNLAADAHLMIGAKDSGGNTFNNSVSGFGSFFTGKIYDVRVYDYALSQFQIGAVVPGLKPMLLNQVISGANGGKLVLTWNAGTLFEATNIAGPWTTNAGQTSPVTNDMTKPADFFKVSNP